MPETGHYDLASLGWNSFFEEAFSSYREQKLYPARVAIQHKNYYVLYSTMGELRGEVTGKMEYFAGGPSDLPAVGDWVVIDARPREGSATIVDLLPRRTRFSRKVPGPKPQEQILAANIDTAFIVSGLDAEFNLRRIERYLVLVAESGADPVLVFNKTDLSADPKTITGEIRKISGDHPVVFISAWKNEGLDELAGFLQPGGTGALLGSSGVGKTTIVNRLLGSDERRIQPVREHDSRGRHTTSYRELIPLPSGGLLIDTPGLRELQLGGVVSGVGEAFQDIEDLAQLCKFRDCSHETEPGCAVRVAIETGKLDAKRYGNYRKLLRELAYENRKHDAAAQRQEKERIKKIMTAYRRSPQKGRP